MPANSLKREKVPRRALWNFSKPSRLRVVPVHGKQFVSIRATPSSRGTVDVSDDIGCTHVIELLWDYLDGEIDAEEAEAINRHLGICSGCRGLLAFDRSFLHAVRRLGDDHSYDVARIRH
jgi:hypothetical protein